MTKYDMLVNRVIANADILLIVIDARRVKESINKKLERRIINSKKKYLYVINKIDLNMPEKIPNSVQISAREHIGTMGLLRKIMEIGRGKEVTVGVVGFPNTGKSTVINALKGRRSAPVSSVSGYTKGLQKVRVNDKIMMIDTPGVFSYERKDDILIGAIDSHKVRDPEYAAAELIKKLDGLVEKYFGVAVNKDSLKTLEEIALKKHILKKGGLADVERMGAEILRLCQVGKI